MNTFFENHIVIECDELTLKEEGEIIDLTFVCQEVPLRKLGDELALDILA